MKYYNFLAKAPGTVVVSGKRHRLMAGGVLRLPEAQGKLIAERSASGYQYVMLVGIDEGVPKKGKELVKEIEKEAEVFLDPKPELPNNPSIPTPELNKLMEADEEVHWMKVKKMVEKAETEGSLNAENIATLKETFSDYKTILSLLDKILEGLQK